MSYETRQRKYRFVLAHSEARIKPYAHFHKPAYTTSNAVCQKRLHKRSLIQARHSVLSGSRKHSEKIFRFRICWKACEIIFVSMNCLRWIKCICTRTMNNKLFWRFFLCTSIVFILFMLCYNQIRRYAPHLTLRWGTWVYSLWVFSVPRRSLSWRVHLAQWTQYCQIYRSIYQLNATFSKWLLK